MDVNSLLVGMARQMYKDVRFVTHLNPKEIVDDDTAGMYNSLLSEVRQQYGNHPLLKNFREVSPRTLKYKDALVVIGQLTSLLVLLEEMRRPKSAGAIAPADPLGEDDTGETNFDKELYGPTPPSKVNDDGTIPFTLED